MSGTKGHSGGRRSPAGGRPPKRPDDLRIARNVRLSPEADRAVIAYGDARGIATYTGALEALILASVRRPLRA